MHRRFGVLRHVVLNCEPGRCRRAGISTSSISGGRLDQWDRLLSGVGLPALSAGRACRDLCAWGSRQARSAEFGSISGTGCSAGLAFRHFPLVEPVETSVLGDPTGSINGSISGTGRSAEVGCSAGLAFRHFPWSSLSRPLCWDLDRLDQRRSARSAGQAGQRDRPISGVGLPALSAGRACRDLCGWGSRQARSAGLARSAGWARPAAQAGQRGWPSGTFRWSSLSRPLWLGISTGSISGGRLDRRDRLGQRDRLDQRRSARSAVQARSAGSARSAGLGHSDTLPALARRTAAMKRIDTAPTPMNSGSIIPAAD